MPMFRYECPDHGIQVFSGHSFSEEAKVERVCRVCGGSVVRCPGVPSSRSVEVIDWGWMARPVERLDNAREIHHQHAKVGRQRMGIEKPGEE